MARLAIRATGDRNKREHVASDNERVTAAVWVGNKCMGTLELRQHSDLYTYVRWYSTESKCQVLATWDGYSDTHSA
jgi:hypothetical protein